MCITCRWMGSLTSSGTRPHSSSQGSFFCLFRFFLRGEWLVDFFNKKIDNLLFLH